MGDEVTTFNHFNTMVEKIPNPTALWLLFTNHLNDVIADCNALLNPKRNYKNYTKKTVKEQEPRLFA